LGNAGPIRDQQYRSERKFLTPSAAVYGQLDMPDVSLSTVSTADVQAGFTPLLLCTFFENAGMPDCPASRQSGTGMEKSTNAGTSPVPE
jgi:hypothetical protein